MKAQILPRSIAIPKSLARIDFPSLFSAFLYPALGVALFLVAVLLGALHGAVDLRWWYFPLAFLVFAITVVVCNMGIGALHRIFQHKAGELAASVQVVAMLNIILAMQGTVRDWVNYHSQHHRFSDQPGDPHNPHEGKRWAWVGWLLWRDPKDLNRPWPLWLRDNKVVRFIDDRFNLFSLIIHLLIPAAIYLIVWAAGGSLVLTALLHASAVLGRAAQFHATILGVNVFGHYNMPAWFTHILALFTGGEAFHDHHHDEPRSALHRPVKGVWNRIVDYNGTFLLWLEKAGLARNLAIPARFAA